MCNRNRVTLSGLILSVTILAGQVNVGGTGLGDFASSAQPRWLGNTPGFSFDLSSKASTSDPSSWRYLRFTIIKANYGGVSLKGDNGLFRSGSNLNQIMFILPIKQKYAFGLGLEPYLDQSYHLTSEISTFKSWEDTLTLSGSMQSAGGMSQAFIGFGTRFNERIDVGIKFSGLFGSRRVKSSLDLGNDNFVQWTRSDYSGSLVQFYLSFNDMQFHSYSLWVKTSLGLAFSPVSITKNQYQLFQDVNESGINDDFHDLYDFPSSVANLEPVSSTINDVHAPFFIELATGVHTGKTSQLVTQVSYWKENGKNADEATLNHQPLNNNLNWSLTWHKFTGEYTKTLPSRLRYSTGIYGSQFNFTGNSVGINEVGVTTRLGIKFGVTDNYIDFDYSYGLRSGGLSPVDTIQKFSINLSLSDIWFVKRREI
ncbi:MAG: hypothetical protein GXO90_06490 [FCB group bacterium]|nr:hypothetical protein [FCB group bacterium]